MNFAYKLINGKLHDSKENPVTCWNHPEKIVMNMGQPNVVINYCNDGCMAFKLRQADKANANEKSFKNMATFHCLRVESPIEVITREVIVEKKEPKKVGKLELSVNDKGQTKK
ncbi:MAG: hypothetical protein WCT77_01625 [Bacteroidota bacterium]